ANLPAGTVLNFPDQDVLNAATNQNALYLPQKFNFFDENVGDGKGVIHYAGRKPWGVLCIHPLRKLYFKYVKLSPYKKDFRFIRLRSLLKTLKSNPFFFFSKNHLRILKNLILLKLGLIKGHGSIN
ncbi:MAG: hypothetical protein LBB93_05020, partial [Elusimicrobiota bacterium]|nr:hypothetical protein [Elusimicrobiota bacterium]